MQKNSIKFLAVFLFLILFIICVLIKPPHIESDIQKRVTDTLSPQIQKDIRVSVSGRDVKLAGIVSSPQIRDNIINNAKVYGARTVTDSLTIIPPKPKTVKTRYLLNYPLKEFTLTQEQYTVLDTLARYVNQHPMATLEIHGHTDNVGDTEHNLELSEKRAKSVYQYLSKQGLAENRVNIFSHGQSEPLASNENETGRAKNRRVEIIIKE